MDTGSSGGKKWWGWEKIKIQAIRARESRRESLLKGSLEGFERDSLDPKILGKEQVCFSFP